MKRNLDSYSDVYDKVIELSKSGKSISEIAADLNIPYSTVYSWLKKGRKKTQSERFYEFIKNNGPITISDVKEKFPKHSDVFLKAITRGFPIKKYDSGLKEPFRFWYYVDGQEKKVKEVVSKLKNTIDEVKERIRERI